jgi:hypothetical protein
MSRTRTPTWSEVQERAAVALLCDESMPARIVRHLTHSFTDGLLDRTAADRTARARGKKPSAPPPELRIMRDLALLALAHTGVCSTREARRRFYLALHVWVVTFFSELTPSAVKAERARRGLKRPVT